MMYLPACSEEFVVINVTGDQTAVSCPGTLSLVDTSTLIPAFTMADIDMAIAGQTFAASFIVVGMFAVAGFALRQLVQASKGRF
ncbi:MAG: hypothetical protein OQK94_00535 [Gammaproteobacteria bacterium]|nr:hypothetical protein [Gammaproteobacteria bacterium]MCW8839961.1 hypothetical protein [Gammaproteobacteria bacterium]MCW8959326.1 hypothetical protein [Gammaproteobacteria bacterium]MCW8993773.1 hypothetical protein [Gammaproteobacteria bacterium]